MLFDKCVVIPLIALLNLKGTTSNSTKNSIEIRNQNWTSCEEFMIDSHYHIEELVDVDWILFYRWGLSFVGSYEFPVRFYKPSRQLVDRFQSLLEAEPGGLSSKVNWSAAQLFVETMYGSSLLVREARQGRFTAVTYTDTYNYYNGSPLASIAIKNIGRYVGLMTCQTREASALAPADALPDAADVEEIASLMGINQLGVSYVPLPLNLTTPGPEISTSELHPPYGFEDRNVELDY